VPTAGLATTAVRGTGTDRGIGTDRGTGNRHDDDSHPGLTHSLSAGEGANRESEVAALRALGMRYELTTETEALREWTRADGTATIRLRERSDGAFVVRFDQLHQAETGRGYAYEVRTDRAAAEALVDDWRADPPV
jgi:hypothetical protein